MNVVVVGDYVVGVERSGTTFQTRARTDHRSGALQGRSFELVDGIASPRLATIHKRRRYPRLPHTQALINSADILAFSNLSLSSRGSNVLEKPRRSYF